MYLLSLNTISYIAVTIMLGVFFIISYIYRRSYNDSHDFFTLGKSNGSSGYTQLNIGLIEFVLLGAIGAKFGISGFYYLLPSIILYYLLSRKHNNPPLSYWLDWLLVVYRIIGYIVLLILTIIIFASMAKFLFGWTFVNSVLGLTGFTLVIGIMGGRHSLQWCQRLSKIILLTVAALALFIVVEKGMCFSLINNLHELALSQGYTNNYYFGQLPGMSILAIISTSIIITIGLASMSGRNKFNYTSLPLAEIAVDTLLIFLVVMLGVISLATKPASTLIKGKQIVTYQTQLNNGEIAYMVKTIASNKPNTPQLGIIPLKIDDNNQVVAAYPEYNYNIAALVALNHYLPPTIGFMLLISLMALFITTVLHYLLNCSSIVVASLANYVSWQNFTPQTGQLWLARVSMVILVLIALFTGGLLQSLDLNFIYLWRVLLAVTLLPALFLLWHGIYGKK